MAYVSNDNIVPAPYQGQPPAAPIASGGKGLGGGKSKANQTQGNNAPQQPSAQLSAYLSANQPQSQEFAGKIATNLSNQVGQAQAGINPAVQNYTGNIYSVAPDQEIANTVAQNPAQIYQNPQQPTGQYQYGNESQLGDNNVANPERAEAFKKMYTAAEKGPTSTDTFEKTQDYQNIAGNIQKAVEQANLWNRGNSIADLRSALEPFSAQRSTAGARTLDALLLSQLPENYSQIRYAVAPASNLQSNLSNATQQANKALSDAITSNQASSQMAKNAVSQYKNNLTNYLNNLVETTQSNINQNRDLASRVYGNYTSQALTEQDAAALGVPAGQAKAFADSFNKLNPMINSLNSFTTSAPARYIGPTNMTPVDFSKYISQPSNPIPATAANVASAKDYSNIGALQKLLEGEDLGLPISLDTKDQAGKALNQAQGNTFDLAKAQQDFANLLTPAKSYLNMVKQDDVRNPAKTSAQAQVITKAVTEMTNVINYLNQLAGISGAGIA